MPLMFYRQFSMGFKYTYLVDIIPYAQYKHGHPIATNLMQEKHNTNKRTGKRTTVYTKLLRCLKKESFTVLSVSYPIA